MFKAVRLFAQRMNEKFLTRKERYGNSWMDCDVQLLHNKLDEEIEEFKKNKDPKELIDISNVAMMLYHRMTMNPDPLAPMPKWMED
jgi:hypothetical protein